MDEPSPWARPTLPGAGWYHDGTVLRWWDGERWGPAAPPAQTSWQPIDEVDQGKTLAVLSHVGMFILAIILPLIFRQTEGKTNRYVRHHATEALNFQLTFLILWIGGIITVVSIAASTTDSNGDTSGWIVLPFLVLFALYVACAVLAIIGAVQAPGNADGGATRSASRSSATRPQTTDHARRCVSPHVAKLAGQALTGPSMSGYPAFEDSWRRDIRARYSDPTGRARSLASRGRRRERASGTGRLP